MKVCPVCEGEFEPEHPNAKFCSEKCSRLNRSRQPYSKARNAGRSTAQMVAKAVVKEQGFACAICRWQLDDYGEGVEVHHIIPVAAGGTHEPTNLIALCPNHHKEADKGLLSPLSLQSYRQEAIKGNPLKLDWYWAKIAPAIKRLDELRQQRREEAPIRPIKKRRKSS
jgi:5-methylcytosine-specific restriction endonuclease McrA